MKLYQNWFINKSTRAIIKFFLNIATVASMCGSSDSSTGIGILSLLVHVLSFEVSHLLSASSDKKISTCTYYLRCGGSGATVLSSINASEGTKANLGIMSGFRGETP